MTCEPLTAYVIRDRESLQRDLDNATARWNALAPFYSHPMRSQIMRDLAEEIADTADALAAACDAE